MVLCVRIADNIDNTAMHSRLTIAQLLPSAASVFNLVSGTLGTLGQFSLSILRITPRMLVPVFLFDSSWFSFSDMSVGYVVGYMDWAGSVQ